MAAAAENALPPPPPPPWDAWACAPPPPWDAFAGAAGAFAPFVPFEAPPHAACVAAGTLVPVHGRGLLRVEETRDGAAPPNGPPPPWGVVEPARQLDAVGRGGTRSALRGFVAGGIAQLYELVLENGTLLHATGDHCVAVLATQQARHLGIGAHSTHGAPDDCHWTPLRDLAFAAAVTPENTGTGLFVACTRVEAHGPAAAPLDSRVGPPGFLAGPAAMGTELAELLGIIVRSGVWDVVGDADADAGDAAYALSVEFYGDATPAARGHRRKPSPARWRIDTFSTLVERVYGSAAAVQWSYGTGASSATFGAEISSALAALFGVADTGAAGGGVHACTMLPAALLRAARAEKIAFLRGLAGRPHPRGMQMLLSCLSVRLAQEVGALVRTHGSDAIVSVSVASSSPHWTGAERANVLVGGEIVREIWTRATPCVHMPHERVVAPPRAFGISTPCDAKWASAHHSMGARGAPTWALRPALEALGVGADVPRYDYLEQVRFCAPMDACFHVGGLVLQPADADAAAAGTALCVMNACMLARSAG